MSIDLKMETFRQELGLRLRKARVANKKTQRELGVMAGISTKVIGRMERGDTSVALAKWLNVAEILGLFATWRDVFKVTEDPFVQYDRQQKAATDLMKKRVRHRKK